MNINKPDTDNWNKIAKYLAGENAEDDFKWTSAENEQAVSGLQEIWELSKHAVIYEQIDTNKALIDVKRKAGISDTVNPKSTGFRKIIRYAAVILLIAGFTGTGLYFINKTGYETIENVNQASLTHSLPDGSTIILNQNSYLTYNKNFDGKNIREVQLKGEAIFHVKKDPVKPFSIHTAYSIINVLGTKFNVKVKPSAKETRIYVQEGMVELASKNNGQPSQKILTPGIVGIHSAENGKIRTDSAIFENDMAWYTRKMVFHETALKEVQQIIESTYHVSLQFSDVRLKELKLTATFEKENLDVVLEVISRTFNLSFRKKEERIVVFHKNST